MRGPKKRQKEVCYSGGTVALFERYKNLRQDRPVSLVLATSNSQTTTNTDLLFLGSSFKN